MINDEHAITMLRELQQRIRYTMPYAGHQYVLCCYFTNEELPEFVEALDAGIAALEAQRQRIILASGEIIDANPFGTCSRCGEWVWKKDEDALRTYDLLCSECGYKIFTCENYDNVEQAKKVVDDRIREGKTLFSFCPNCGADMRKERETND